jgi:prepilin peptidase CpaA
MIANILILAILMFFPLLMALSASSDLFTMTIPNKISIALVLGYFALAIALGVPAKTIAINVGCALGVLIVTFAMFSRGWIGGGDAKLAAATALWIGGALLLDYSLMASVFGGIITFALIVGRKFALPARLSRLEWLARLHQPKGDVPYGIALAIAGLVVYPQTQIWQAAAGL